MSFRSFGAFGPEALAEMGEVLDAAYKRLQNTGEPHVVTHRKPNYCGGKTWGE
jgi:hypothetical protein